MGVLRQMQTANEQNKQDEQNEQDMYASATDYHREPAPQKATKPKKRPIHPNWDQRFPIRRRTAEQALFRKLFRAAASLVDALDEVVQY